MPTTTVPVPSTSTPSRRSFDRSLANLVRWLDRLAATAATAAEPAAADLTTLDSLLADVWMTGAHADGPGLEPGSVQQQRFRQLVGPALMESHSVRHAMLKPRGYPGDFQLMEAIYHNEPAGTTPRGRWLDVWALQLPFAHAVRTRRDILIDLLAQAWLAGGRRVTNIACGSAPELAAVQRRLPFASITLLDQDDGALQAASRAFPTDTTTAIALLHRPVRDLLAGRCRLELGQDVIYSIGLYDYLPAPTAAALTRRLWEAVGPGGLLVVGNFAQGAQPDRPFLEAALDWWLTYRTPAELLQLLDGLREVAEAHVRTEPTGSLHLLVVRKTGGRA